MIFGIDGSQANRKIRSGTEWYAFHLIQEFKKMLGGQSDLKIRLYTRDPLLEDLGNSLPENFEVRILRWPFPFFWGQIRLSLEMLLNPPDKLFCPAHAIPIVHPKKTFTTLHDVGFEDYPELYDRLSLWYHKWSAKLAVKNAAHIFTVSNFSKERIIENYGDDSKSKISVTYLGIAENEATAQTASILSHYNLIPKSYFLYVGRLEPKKNILNLIKGYEQFLSSRAERGDLEIASSSTPRNDTEFDLVLAGRKVDIQDVETYLEKRAELKKRIRFIGYFDEQDKAALYSGAKIFLFPTLYEGFGLPILEAQAAGIPVITSNTASNPEIAAAGAILINPDSPYEIGEAIKRFLIDENLRKEKISLGYENVKRFNWSETAKKTWEILSR